MHRTPWLMMKLVPTIRNYYYAAIPLVNNEACFSNQKPVVLVTTKNEEGNEIFVREAERLVNRKGTKSLIENIIQFF